MGSIGVDIRLCSVRTQAATPILPEGIRGLISALPRKGQDIISIEPLLIPSQSPAIRLLSRSWTLLLRSLSVASDVTR
jgi:hypothetical protein